MADHGRLRPGIPLLWRSLTDVQIGTDPRWAVVLGDLSAGASRALRDVPAGADLRALRSTLADHDVDPLEIRAVLDHLRAAQHVVGAPARTGSHPDRTTWSLLDASGDGDGVLAARGRRRVRVEGLDRLGSGIAIALACAGIGTVEPDDDGVVGAEDVGAGGLEPEHVGLDRREAVRQVLRRRVGDVRVGAPGRRAPDLVVLVEHGAADPLRHRGLVADGVPHLSVVVREASVVVGPLVLPGRTSCLRCADLHRADRDPRWPALVAQLVGVTAPTETTLVLGAVALATAQVTAHLDGRPAVTAGTSLELRLPDLLPRSTTWPPHPRCGCGGLDES